MRPRSLASILVFTVACSGGGDSTTSTSADGSSPTSTTASGSTTVATTSTLAPVNLTYDIDDFRMAVDASLADPAMSYRLEANQTIPGLVEAEVIREGGFDTATGNGEATVAFVLKNTFGRPPDDPIFAAALGEPAAFRLLDETIWVRLTGTGDIGWVGWDAAEFGDLSGTDSTERVSFAAPLGAVRQAGTRVVNAIERDDGTVVLIVDFEAVGLLPVLAASGLRRALEAREIGRGLVTQGVVIIDGEGRLQGFSVVLDELWRQVVEATSGFTDDGVALTLSFALDPAPVTPPEPPCDTPTSEVTEDGQDILRCPA